MCQTLGLAINIQSIILVAANRWRRTDGGGRSCWKQHFDALRGRTEPHISPNAHQSLSSSRTQSPSTGQTGTRWTLAAMETRLVAPLGVTLL